jgi:hypothetical protein
MTQIAIRDEVASILASAATERGCSPEELAAMFIEEGLRREEEFELTPEQETRLLHSFAQSQRGELIDGDVVMAKFEGTLQRIASR